jgi:hypothetical protein
MMRIIKIAVKYTVMKHFVFALVVIFFSTSLLAQDSTIIYYKKDGFQTLSKDSSYQYTVFIKQGNLWYGKSYYTKSRIFQSQGTYIEKDGKKIPDGSFDNYDENGVLSSTNFYGGGKVKTITSYYPSGKKKSYREFDENWSVTGKGWNEDGSVMKDYIAQQEASFKGSIDKWRKYLIKNLDNNVAKKYNAPVGRYTVIVLFTVDREGNIVNVRAENELPSCPPCITEAIRVIKSAPAWKPAIQDNQQVLFNQRQSISFEVVP